MVAGGDGMRIKTRWLLCLTLLLCTVLGCASARADYQSLCAQRGISGDDLIAWIEIPGASLLEPIMRHPADDAYYAKHDPAGKERSAGSLYVQASYNTAGFEDPVTLVYGSSESEIAPFGMLQELYSGSYDACRSIYLHLPEKTVEYAAFAAVPFSSLHILHYYDFSNARRYSQFFDSVFSTRVLSMHLDENNRPEAGRDRVLILSTALRGDSLQRYLVMAKPVSR